LAGAGGGRAPARADHAASPPSPPPICRRRYLLAFPLGAAARAAAAPSRLPAGWGPALLLGSGIYWVEAGFAVWIADGFALMGPGTRPAVRAAVLVARTFVEQSFAVVWSAGVLIAARDAANWRPGRLGGVIIGAAYAAYVIHPIFVVLFARALYLVPTKTLVTNALAIAPLSVVSAWLAAAALKAIPGVGRVL
jgi:glucan biosynthesis protein C